MFGISRAPHISSLPPPPRGHVKTRITHRQDHIQCMRKCMINERRRHTKLINEALVFREKETGYEKWANT